MPERATEAQVPARAFWSGTITFGLVNIPVNLFAAVHARRTAMKMVDSKGKPLGREYYCPKDGEKLDQNDLVRGYETDDGKIVVVTDEELESVAPEMTRDIELRRFVPLSRIDPAYFDRPYFLTPSGKSTRAYHLLAATMERSGRAGIGTFVMRERQYLVAIVSEGGLLRAETLRFGKELRKPEEVDLPKVKKAAAKRVNRIARVLSGMTRKELDASELSDRLAARIAELVASKEKAKKDVVTISKAADEDEQEGGGAEVIDLMKVIRQRLSAKAEVKTADAGASSKASDEASGRTAAASARKRRAGGAARHARRKSANSKTSKAGGSDQLDGMTKAQLQRQAAKLDIAGRSRMGKNDLIEAIRNAD